MSSRLACVGSEPCIRTRVKCKAHVLAPREGITHHHDMRAELSWVVVGRDPVAVRVRFQTTMSPAMAPAMAPGLTRAGAPLLCEARAGSNLGRASPLSPLERVHDCPEDWLIKPRCIT